MDYSDYGAAAQVHIGLGILTQYADDDKRAPARLRFVGEQSVHQALLRQRQRQLLQ